MGQYHKAYNATKKEFIHPHRIDNGLKLMEQVGFDKSTATALFLLLANSNGRGGGDAKVHPLIGHWAGDNIVIQGDYTEPTDAGHIDENTLGTFKDISAQVVEMLNNEFGE
jgi:hypothetical protein